MVQVNAVALPLTYSVSTSLLVPPTTAAEELTYKSANSPELVAIQLKVAVDAPAQAAPLRYSVAAEPTVPVQKTAGVLRSPPEAEPTPDLYQFPSDLQL